MHLDDIFRSDLVPSDDHSEIRMLWVLRILCRTNAKSRYLGKGRVPDALHAFLGTLDEAFETRKSGEISRLLENKLAALEARNPTIQEPLRENLAHLQDLLGLTEVEIEVLALRTMYRTDEVLVELLNKDGSWTDSRLVRMLATALGRENEEIQAALCPGSALLSSGLVRIDPCITHFFNKFALIAGLPNALLRENRNLAELISFSARQAPPPTLDITDFPYIRDDIELLSGYLRRALQNRTTGVNVLLYGEPGVGKSEFVRVLSAALNVDAYEVSMADGEGNPLTPSERFTAYMFNQKLFSKQSKQLILFDEIEDVLPDALRHLGNKDKHARLEKAWMNRLLEENPVPAFWVANRVSHIDPAYLRRFDYILHLRNPNRLVRKRILTKSLEGLSADASWLDSQADDARLTPAFFSRTARVLKLAQVAKPGKLAGHFERMANNLHDAQGLTAKQAPYHMSAMYRLDYINANVSMTALSEKLAVNPHGRVLLYGPPGSGKTAFAHHLGKLLDMPVMSRRSSDLLSHWLGGTETNLMHMFQEATTDNALLLLDEADSFLQDRLRAIRSWEITQVNELLTQMEAFQGLFVCTTNFFENLDRAALRRFSLKIGFDYLTPDQRFALFQEYLPMERKRLLDPAEMERLRVALSNLDNLTAGDFVPALQRMDLFCQSRSIESLLSALREECDLKPDSGKIRMGFLG